MLAFRTNGEASVFYTANFANVAYANISFFDQSGRDIPFHLSLRYGANLAVVNHRKGQNWGKELSRDISVDSNDNLVEIRFADTEIRVFLNDVEIFNFNGDFSGIDQITALDSNGGIQPQSFRFEGEAQGLLTGHGKLFLWPNFLLEGWGFVAERADQSFELAVAGMSEPPVLTIIPRADLIQREGAPHENVGVQTSLPGRIWEALAEGESTITLQLLSHGAPCGGTFEISRTDAVQQVEEIARLGNPKERAFEALLALEHVRFGKLLPSLSPACQAFILNTARLYGVEAFLNDTDAEEGPVLVQIPRPAADLQLRDQVIDGFLMARKANPNVPAIDAFDQILGDLLPTPGLRQQIFLTVADYFCAEGTFDTLFAYARLEGLDGFRVGKEAYQNSLVLPYLLKQGKEVAFLEAFKALSETKTGWVSWAAVSWTIREIVSGQHTISEGGSEEAIHLFLTGIRNRAENYFEAVQNAHLRDATLALLAKSAYLGAGLQKTIVNFSICYFGLSRAFWEGVAAHDLSAKLSALKSAEHAFHILSATPRASDQDLRNALRVFDRYEAIEARRVRRELLGPSGVGMDPTKERSERLFRELRDPEEAALRTLAFPEQEDPELAPIAREVMTSLWSGINMARAPFAALQKSTSEYVFTALESLRSGKPLSQTRLNEDLLPALSRLSSQRSGFIGLSFGVSLLTGSIRAGDDETSVLMIRHLGKMVAGLKDDERGALHNAQAVKVALMRLVRDHGADTRLPRACLALFPQIATEGDPRGSEGLEGLTEASPLFDTIVTVFSCKPYLDTRVSALRETWLATLQALGIPYVVVVGDGKGQLEGDVVHLDAPDDYEGLPLKTLKTVEWVYENTPYSYLLKVDDDCFLNAPEFFHSQSYRKFHYYGRRINRQIGDMDRLWHHEKSRSARGQLELDKSPEPSVYADGGTAYTLSRQAMVALLEKRNTFDGQRLVQNSFMEDKLIGDLLQRAGITVADEDYHIAVMRRSYGKAIPVSIWANGFYPSSASEIKLIHLDTEHRQKDVLDNLDRPRLFPRKVWPSYQRAALGYNSNAVELVSSETKLRTLNDAPLAVVACMRNEMFMLPHFLKHHRALGIESFLVVDNFSDDGTLEYLESQPDVVAFSADTDYGESAYGVAWQQALMSNFRVGRWSLVADADEMLVYPDWQKTSINTLLAQSDMIEAEAVRIFMLDMYPEGSLGAATFETGDLFAEAGFVDRDPFLTITPTKGPFAESETWTSTLRHRLIPGSRHELFVAQKIALLKYQPWMRLAAGMHYVSEARLAKQDLLFAHFKYNAEFRKKAQLEVQRKQHFNNAEEYRKYLAVLSEGRDQIYSPELSVPWAESPFVKKVMGQG
ncbi:MAG: glycosyltransferase family 2 protein [Pseudoruegeria sp.]